MEQAATQNVSRPEVVMVASSVLQSELRKSLTGYSSQARFEDTSFSQEVESDRAGFRGYRQLWSRTSFENRLQISFSHQCEALGRLPGHREFPVELPSGPEVLKQLPCIFDRGHAARSTRAIMNRLSFLQWFTFCFRTIQASTFPGVGFPMGPRSFQQCPEFCASRLVLSPQLLSVDRSSRVPAGSDPELTEPPSLQQQRLAEKTRCDSFRFLRSAHENVAHGRVFWHA